MAPCRVRIQPDRQKNHTIDQEAGWFRGRPGEHPSHAVVGSGPVPRAEVDSADAVRNDTFVVRGLRSSAAEISRSAATPCAFADLRCVRLSSMGMRAQ